MIPPPQRLRPDAPFGVLDVSEYFGASSGGVRTYLLQKRRFVADHPGLRQVLVTPGAHDAVHDEPGSRWYQLRGPAIPFQPSYRFLLATRSVRRIIDRERPDLIEVGSSYFAPWVGHHARRHVEVPVVWF
ncbi:MAG: glycosyltransferase, partial [Gemmatimonadales bacterium]|nr:glycosyltransferase [Gemmatimonadales bacterium]